MFKLCVFVALIAYASAGLISTGLIDEGISLGGLGGLGSLGGLSHIGSLGGLSPIGSIGSLGGLSTIGGLGGLEGLGGLGGLGGIALGSKVIAAPTIALKAGATSYQNSNLLALNPTPVVTKSIAAPIAAPIVTKVASPISILGLGHVGLGNLGLGGLGLGIH